MYYTKKWLEDRAFSEAAIRWWLNNDLDREDIDITKVTGDYNGCFKDIALFTEAWSNNESVWTDTSPVSWIVNGVVILQCIYDHKKKLVRRTDAMGVCEYVRDGKGRVVEEYLFDRTYNVEYDKTGNVVKKIQKDGIKGTYLFEYDKNKNMIKETTPGNDVYTYKHDNRNNVIERKSVQRKTVDKMRYIRTANYLKLTANGKMILTIPFGVRRNKSTAYIEQ